MAPYRIRAYLWALVLLFQLAACGRVANPPAAFDPATYTPIDTSLLLTGAPAGLQPGQRVSFRCYFWEFLSYDPGIRYYYFNLLRYPQQWGALEWFAVYRDATMTGYFDRLAMSYAQRLTFRPKRLDPLIIYGELLPFGGRDLYLLVHHLEVEPQP